MIVVVRIAVLEGLDLNMRGAFVRMGWRQVGGGGGEAGGSIRTLSSANLRSSGGGSKQQGREEG
jgi:hypothetical protein